MADRGLGITVLVSLLCGLLGGIIGSLAVTAFTAGMFAGGVAAAIGEPTEPSSPDLERAKRTMADMQMISTVTGMLT